MSERVPEWQQAAEDVAALLGDEQRSEEIVRMTTVGLRVAYEGSPEQRAHAQALVIKMGEHGDDGPKWWTREVEEYMGWA